MSRPLIDAVARNTNKPLFGGKALLIKNTGRIAIEAIAEISIVKM